MMLWLLRAAAYGISAVSIWQFAQGGSTSTLGMHRHITLDQAHGMVLGVCAGISNYTGVNVSILRVVWALGSFYKGVGIVLYILAFLLMPTL